MSMKWTVWILIVLLMQGMLRKTVLLVDFYVHQESIEKSACIQKDAPVNTCHGHCVLSESLNETQENTPDYLKLPELQVFVDFALELDFPRPYLTTVKHQDHLVYHPLDGFLSGQIKPPLFI